MVGVPSYTKVDAVEVTHYDLHEYGWMRGRSGKLSSYFLIFETPSPLTRERMCRDEKLPPNEFVGSEKVIRPYQSSDIVPRQVVKSPEPLWRAEKVMGRSMHGHLWRTQRAM